MSMSESSPNPPSATDRADTAAIASTTTQATFHASARGHRRRSTRAEAAWMRPG